MVESLLETYCKSCRVEVIFLPKNHCELNFIEQCWGYAKQIYRHYPASLKEADLKHNMLAALKTVPLESMRK
jgi:transposase